MDLDALYRQVIMDNYKNPKNKGLKDEEGYQTLHLNNPSCGDEITIQIKEVDGKIVDVRQDGRGCSICCSSASVMTESLIGLNKNDANKMIENFLHMVMDEGFDDEMDMGEAIVYQGVRQFPARVKCASLAWKAAGKIINEE